jgi:hypothetical protein
MLAKQVQNSAGRWEEWEVWGGRNDEANIGDHSVTL